MKIPINRIFTVEKIIFDDGDHLTVKVRDENKVYEYHFIEVLRFFFYKEKENLRINRVDDLEKIKKYERRFFDGPAMYTFILHQFTDVNNEICMEVLSKSYDVRAVGNK